MTSLPIQSDADLWFLRPLSSLNPLSREQRNALRKVVMVEELKRGSRLYVSGDPAGHVYLLRCGVVKLGGPLPEGEFLTEVFVYPGDLFGEAALVDEAPRDHAAEVHEDAVICAVPREPLVEIMRQTPEFACQIARLMADRLRVVRTRVTHLLHHSAQARIALTLVALARQYGTEVDRGLVIPLRLSQRDLAGLVGVRRETVNLVLHEFRARGLLESGPHRLVLHDLETLVSMR